MATIKSLQKAEKFEIETFKSPKDVRSLSKNHVPYTGSPKKHPLDPEQIILVPDPYSEISPYMEFSKSDITYVEKLANIVNISGETVSMARIWVKKAALPCNVHPFRWLHSDWTGCAWTQCGIIHSGQWLPSSGPRCFKLPWIE